MMNYTVLSEFADLQDGNHIYRVGDEYPRKGYSPTDERVDELCTGKNLLHKPLIQKVEVQEPETVEEEVVETPETEEQQPEEIAEETEAEEEQPKRKRVKKNTDD